MLHHSETDIQAKVKEIWADDPEPDVASVHIADDGTVRIRLSASYSAPSLSFEKLSALAEFFDTKNINDDERFSNEGCETCDYGSSYGFELVVRP